MQASYKKAFAKLLSEIEGEKVAFSKHEEILLKYATTADYQGRYAMTELVPESDWTWPAYDEQILQPMRAEKQWEVDLIKTEVDVVLLTRLKFDELRLIANGRAKGKNKAELIERLAQVIPVSELADIVEKSRDKLIKNIENWSPRYEDRCAWFLRRLANYAFSITNVDKMHESFAAGVNIKAEFNSGNPENTPQACLDANGKVASLDSCEIINKAPCEKLSCSCSWLPSVDFGQPLPGGYQSTLKPTLKTYQTNAELRAQAAEFAKRAGLSPGRGLPKPNMLTILRARLKYWLINKL